MTQISGVVIPPMPKVSVGEQRQILQQVWQTILDSEKKILRRLLEISYKHKLSHLGSCLSAAPIINRIYELKQPSDVFILSAGHAALALYCVLEDRFRHDAEALFKQHGVHPSRDEEHGIYLSTGSLGQGITVACGVAIASPEKHVYCLLSDGECAEGCVWEAFRLIHERPLHNVTVIINANGFSALSPVDLEYLERRLKTFLPQIVFVRSPSSFAGIPTEVEAHYHVMSDGEYKIAYEALR